MLRYIKNHVDYSQPASGAGFSELRLAELEDEDDSVREPFSARSSQLDEEGTGTATDEEDYVTVNENEIEWVSVDQDVYGAAIYLIIHDSTELWTAREGGNFDQIARPANLLRIVFSVFGLILNVAFQIMVLHFSLFYAVLPSVRKAQVTYQGYHRHCFEKDGTLNQTKWELWDGKESLCNMVFANTRFLYVIISLWWMTMLYEIRQSDRLWRAIHNLKPEVVLARSARQRGDVQGDLQDSVHYLAKPSVTRISDGKEKIYSLSCPVRWTIYIIVVIPKALISCALLVLGTMWLASTESVSELILNAVALEFVVEIDHTLFDALFPQMLQRHIKKAHMMLRRPELNPGKAYMRSVAYLALSLGGVAFYLSPVGQSLPYVSVLPGYAGDALCPVWWEKRGTELCGPFAEETCFPFGQ